MPVMWEYNYFKARRRCRSAISDAQIGAFAPPLDLSFAVPASNCLIISVTNRIEWGKKKKKNGKRRQLHQGAATVSFLFSKEAKFR